MDALSKPSLPHYRRIRRMHSSVYLTLPREWDLDAYEEYLCTRDHDGSIRLVPVRESCPTEPAA